MKEIPHSVTVADTVEIQKLAEALPKLAVARKSVPILTTGPQHQLVLVEDGQPMMSYKVAGYTGSASSEAGMRAIELFLDRCRENRHLVMLYDDPVLARRVEFKYLQIGLRNRRELCLYVIPEDDIESPESIRAQMSGHGIDSTTLERHGALRFVRTPDPGKNPRGFKAGCIEILERLMGESQGRPMRMVLHVRYQLATTHELESHAEFENVIESSFARFPGSMLCNHYIGNYTKEMHGGWGRRMLETHDNVFFVSSSSISPSSTSSGGLSQLFT